MAAHRVFGVVVVGVGMAGRVRIRDLQECSCGLQLKGFVSRRELEIPGVEQLKFPDALMRSDIDAVIICTEPATHADYIRQSLQCGKHVLVEYPVSMASTDTQKLYQLAADRGLVLHEENIALLTESHQQLKEMAAGRKVKSGTSSLIGNYNGWVEQSALSGRPFYSSIAGIQCLYDVFGDLTAVDATLDVNDDGLKYEGKFTPKAGGGTLSIKVERSKAKVNQRTSSNYVKFEDGEVFDSSKMAPSGPPRKPGLFMRDLEIFAARLRGEQPLTESEISRSVRSMELAEEAHTFLKSD